ncbi:MAG: hypothetical protein ABR502_06740 [Chitinophagaceae bacterium]
MKAIILLTCVLSVFLLQACDNDSRYVDVNTGKALNLEKDEKTGLMVDAETGKPVKMYVDTKTNDTIYGRTGKVINTRIRRNTEGVYVYIDDDEDDAKTKVTGDETKIKDGEYKKEVEKDGDITIKDGNTKIKIDGETGKKKVKKDD